MWQRHRVRRRSRTWRPRGQAIPELPTQPRCAFTKPSGPLFVATGVDTKRGVLTVGEDGLISSKPTLGRRLEADRAFVEYATAIDSEAFLKSCDPDAYRPGTVETSKLSESLAWTGECGELWSELSEDVAAWVYAGKPSLGSYENAQRDADSS